MEFNEKLKELRKKKGITQRELADLLYVSRTAVSKWESGRGYPSIESLRLIAKTFSVTVDSLLSSDEVLTLAEENGKLRENRFRDLVFGLLDISMVILFFLPIFAKRIDGTLYTSNLVAQEGQLYLKVIYFISTICIVSLGVLTLALQNCTSFVWVKIKSKASFIISTISALIFIVSLQPYPAIFVIVPLIIKATMLIKW